MKTINMSFDETQAVSEGWSLFGVGGRLQLQRIDCPDDCTEPKFQSDAHAIVEVATKARQGSAYHWDALHLIGTRSEN